MRDDKLVKYGIGYGSSNRKPSQPAPKSKVKERLFFKEKQRRSMVKVNQHLILLNKRLLISMVRVL